MLEKILDLFIGASQFDLGHVELRFDGEAARLNEKRLEGDILAGAESFELIHRDARWLFEYICRAERLAFDEVPEDGALSFTCVPIRLKAFFRVAQELQNRTGAEDVRLSFRVEGEAAVVPAHFIEEIFSAQIEYSFGIFQIVSEVAFNLICGKPEQRSIVGIKSDIFENIEAAC